MEQPDYKIEFAYFASGCFWGTQYYFSKLQGVKTTRVGFMGGHLDNPSYKQVCAQNTGHLECVEVQYHPELINYQKLVEFFFETHDFSQTDGQGPDIGPQYLSCIFYKNDYELSIAESVISELKSKGYVVSTLLREKKIFWLAEDYHQNYYLKNGSMPYCHKYRKIF